MGKEKRGFASLNFKDRQAIARLGAKKLHALGKAHQWTKEEATAAGRKGGLAARGGKGKLRPGVPGRPRKDGTPAGSPRAGAVTEADAVATVAQGVAADITARAADEAYRSLDDDCFFNDDDYY